MLTTSKNEHYCICVKLYHNHFLYMKPCQEDLRWRQRDDGSNKIQIEETTAFNWSKVVWIQTQYLDLASNSFSGTLPPSWSDFGKLRELHLGDNRLTGSLPVQWALLKSLQILSLSDNQFWVSFSPRNCNKFSNTFKPASRQSATADDK